MARKIIILCPARNERANFVRVIPVWEMLADHIIVADQGSTDGTIEFLRTSKKVIVINNHTNGLDEPTRNKLLLNSAREIAPDAIHLHLDADEILSANVLDSPEWKAFCDCEPGTVGEFNWVQLWKSRTRFIARGTLAPGPYALAFIDDGSASESSSKIHEQRVAVKNPERTFRFNDVVCLHYAWVQYEKAVTRNIWYKMWWVSQGHSKYFAINSNHGWHRRVGEAHLDASPDQWFEAYLEAGLDVSSWERSALYWWDLDILRWFGEHGTRRYRLLDVWREVDWEAKRQLANRNGIEDVPQTPLDIPGKGWQIYHALTVDGPGYLWTMLPRLVRGLMRRLLP